MEAGRVAGAVRWRMNGGKETGMLHLTESRAWRTCLGHTTEYRGKAVKICHILIRMNTV